MDNILGKTIRGRYRVVEILGSGGFGETYLAQDFGRPSSPKVVLKKINGQIGDSNAKHMFEKEAKALYQLGEQCKYIPRLHEYFIEDNCFFLVQDHIEGAALNSFLRNAQWDESQVIYLLISVLEILVFIHSQGTIHCDITPNNLILRKSDQRYVLIDFGAVKRIQTSSNISIVLGTPGYMAPEHQYGQPNERSDIYSLGIIGIQALTGLKPQEIPIDPQTKEIAGHIRGTNSSALMDVLSRMTRQNYHERPSAQEALSLLQNIADSSDTQSTKVVLPQQNQQRRIPLHYSILVLFVVVVLAAIPSTITTPNPESIPSPNESLEERPSDIQGISYTKLEEFLANGSWQEAEQETNMIILQMFGRSDRPLTVQEITRIPCRDLRTIDNLWSQYSDGHFGISAQKAIWESFRGRKNSWERTARTLGWRDSNGLAIKSRDLRFDLASSPKGHLPHLEVLLSEQLLYHAKQCNL